jgi:hypothetical protein
VVSAAVGVPLLAVQNQLGQPMTFWSRFPFMPYTYAGLYEQG